MKISEIMPLRALLKNDSSLMSHLSISLQERLETLPESYGDPLHDPFSEQELLSTIHPSWISPFLRNLSEKDIGFYLAALDPSQATTLKKELLFSGNLPPLTSLGKRYLQNSILNHLTESVEDLAPPSCLPSSPLNGLLECKNNTMALLLDFLGLHDLSLEVRQIIDKQKLKRIYETLSPPQLDYLKILLQSHEPLSFVPMGLTGWDGNSEKLRSLVLQRSVNRLGKALYGQDPSLIWYVLHKLSLEQALLVQKLCHPLDNPRATSILMSQILEFLNYTKGLP